MLLERQNITQHKWKMALIPIFFIASVVIPTVLSIYFIGEGPVYEPWLGRSFVWPHVFAVLGLLFFLVFMISNKTHFFDHPSQLFLRQEKALFGQRYFVNEDNQKYLNKNATVIFYVHLFIAFLPVFPIMWFGTNVLNSVVLSRFIAMGVFLIISFRGITRAMMFHSKTGKDFLDKINSHVRNTQLNYKNNFQGSLAGIGIDLNIEGFFKGRKVDIQSSTQAFKVGQDTKMSQSIKAILDFKSNMKFKINEKNPKWHHLEISNLDDYFEKRFDLKGASLNELPYSLKKRISNYPRNLYLEVKQGQLIYYSKDIFLSPFYSMEGMILFLDELNEIADVVENKH